jgi:type VI secretion system secreted protein VgrG
MTTALHTHLEVYCDGVPDGALVAVRMRAVEELSQPHRIDVEVQVPGGGLDAAGLLRRGAELHVVDAGSGSVLRRFSGVVACVRERARPLGQEQRLEITLESPLGALGRSSDSRIFLEQTTQQIVTSVLEACGMPSSKVSFKLAGSYQPRPHCTQLRETMLAFVSRLLEEDGIFYYFEASGSPKLVFGDSAAAYGTAGGLEQIRFVSVSGLTGERGITAARQGARLAACKVTLGDQDFTRPALDLSAKAEASGPVSREYYLAPGRYADPGHGSALAKVLLEAEQAHAGELVLEATVPALAPGVAFEIEDAPLVELGGECVVRRIEHTWDRLPGGNGYSAVLWVLPRSQPYRPQRRTPAPRALGPQSALVTGPSGEEIYSDQYGRVKVQFAWDRHGKYDEKSSGWVRVAQPHLGGAMLVPRIGWEVLVDFEDGDPDRPVVLGRVFDGRHPPPYPLPKQKTTSTLMTFSTPGGSGHNELRIEDAAGKEHVHLYAQKDLVAQVDGDRQETVGGAETVSVKTDEKRHVKKDAAIEISKLSDLTVGGAQTVTVQGKRDEQVGKDERVTVGGSRKLQVSASHSLAVKDVDSTSGGGKFDITIGAAATEEAGEVWRTVVAKDTSLVVGGAKIEQVEKGKTGTSGGASSSLVGGALLVTSKQDVTCTAGGKKSTTVGGGFMVTAGGSAELSTGGELKITVGGALNFTGASAVVLKVGGSSIMVGMGGVVLKSTKVKITSSGPAALLGGLIGLK